MSAPDKRHKILVVDDDEDDRNHIKIAFGRTYDFYFAKDVEHLRRVLPMDYSIDLVLLDLVLDKTSTETVGISLIPEIQKARPNIPIIIMTGNTDARKARDAMKAGAVDFLIKDDYDRKEWEEVFQKAIELRETLREHRSMKAQLRRIFEKEEQEYVFIGESAKIHEIKRQLEIIGEEENATVLILGETGTGKEVAARYLHRRGARSEKPFVGVNLSAIQETLLESTLFGSVKGAYTGSTRDVEGYFRQAEGGVLMLDEIGDINGDIQIKLLRFLENRLIRPVGSDKDVRLNVQIVAATHQSLVHAVQRGTFRADLFQRLKAITVTLPPLRERREDILPILQHYLGPNLPYIKHFDKAALQKLQDYEWVGNVRELRNAVSHMLLHRKIQNKSLVDLDCLPAEIQEYVPGASLLRANHAVPQSGGTNGISLSREAMLELVNLQKIEEALQVKNKVKQDAADLLGYKSADSLLYAVKTCYKRFPQLFLPGDFPLIRASYPQIFR